MIPSNFRMRGKAFSNFIYLQVFVAKSTFLICHAMILIFFLISQNEFLLYIWISFFIGITNEVRSSRFIDSRCLTSHDGGGFVSVSPQVLRDRSCLRVVNLSPIQTELWQNVRLDGSHISTSFVAASMRGEHQAGAHSATIPRYDYGCGYIRKRAFCMRPAMGYSWDTQPGSCPLHVFLRLFWPIAFFFLPHVPDLLSPFLNYRLFFFTFTFFLNVLSSFFHLHCAT